ncbi:MULTISPECIES: hypothetical protein [Streptomyces]|uniref:hypothetical protein n=1 Tax=Streptomyces TaxID=1883 RepID=UPI00067B02B5|nr:MULTISPECIES: hypothetical protein [Streptomyces]MDX2673424.1 hypothetical protein [Streptomyces sp. NRRL_ISP-5395]WKN16928.1 hypothetical protein NEH83_23750 [Streptomyces sp. JUS-F4]GHF62732.1 hypothetical protein GCM10010504_33620 [Streptomyces griseus]
MDPQTAADQLAAAEGAPALNRPATTGERVGGVVSAAALFGALWVAAEQRVPLALGVPVCLAALAVVVGWNYYHRERALRRPHTRLESGAGIAAGFLLGLPAGNVLWDTPDSTIGIVVPAAASALVLLGYLVSRWRA